MAQTLAPGAQRAAERDPDVVPPDRRVRGGRNWPRVLVLVAAALVFLFPF